MNERDLELEQAVRSLVDEGRGTVGPEPTEEELLSYHRGELSTDEADRFEERLAHYPEAAQLLAAFTDEREPEPGDPDYRSEAERAAAWSALQERLIGSRASRRAPRVASPVEFQPEASRRRLQIPRWAERIAAGGAILLLSALWVVHARQVEDLGRQVTELAEPRINPERHSIAPDSRRRGPGGMRAIRLPRDGRPYLLTLALYGAPVFPDYRLEIVPAAEPDAAPIWASSGLERRPDDSFGLLLPAHYLPPGRYELRVYGLEGARKKTLVATYTVEV